MLLYTSASPFKRCKQVLLITSVLFLLHQMDIQFVIEKKMQLERGALRQNCQLLDIKANYSRVALNCSAENFKSLGTE